MSACEKKNSRSLDRGLSLYSHQLFSVVPVKMSGGRIGLYVFLVVLLLIILGSVEDEAVYFQWLTLLVMLVLLAIVDIVFFQSPRAFIFDPFYTNYQKLTKPVDY
jgi:hypothetical protein